MAINGGNTEHGMLMKLQATHSLRSLCPLWLILLNSGSMKLPLTKLNELQSMRRASLLGRCACRKARALSGSEKVDLTSLSWG
jgi:hypothetical protein